MGFSKAICGKQHERHLTDIHIMLCNSNPRKIFACVNVTVLLNTKVVMLAVSSLLSNYKRRHTMALYVKLVRRLASNFCFVFVSGTTNKVRIPTSIYMSQYACMYKHLRGIPYN
jgi:hypothetical protein